MKYLVILGDGMADRPVAALGNETPLAYSQTPAMDTLAAKGMVGTVQTVPAGMEPGSDVANMAILGVDPRLYYTGRAPLEALSRGIPMGNGDVALRCNFVTVSEPGDYDDKILLDHSAGEIETKDAAILLDALRESLSDPDISFYNGTRYRQICIWRQGRMSHLEPPYDHLGQPIGAYLPQDPLLRQLMRRSFAILNDHPINRRRTAEGLPKANSIWFWGGGVKPNLPDFAESTGLKGAMISGVDLLKGLAIGSGMAVLPVSGATGGADTDYEAKAQAAVDALCSDGMDFVFVHVEAPDEMGHRGDAFGKVKVIEDMDGRLIGPICRKLDGNSVDYRMLILPDHPTPVQMRTHTGDSVPFLLYDSTKKQTGTVVFCEKTAVSGDHFRSAEALLRSFLQGG